MGLLDKAKAAAAQAAAQAQKGAAQLQGKVEQAQTRKKADDLAKELGYLIVRERTDGTPAGPRADELVGQITALEAELQAEAGGGDGSGETPAGSATPATPAPPTSASEPAAGDFTLD